MNVLEIVALLVVAAAGAAVVLARDPAKQAIVIAFDGIALSILFVVLEAPEVALSQLAVGAVIVPLLYLATIARTMRRTR